MNYIAKQGVRKVHFMVYIAICIPQYTKLLLSVTSRALSSKLYSTTKMKCYFYFAYFTTILINRVTSSIYIYINNIIRKAGHMVGCGSVKWDMFLVQM